MKTMTTVKRTLAGCGGLALTLALVAGPVAGQERMSEQAPDMSRDMMHHDMMQSGMPGMMQMMQSMHARDGMMGGPTLILRLEGALELTESQVERLKAIQEAAQADMRQHMMHGMMEMGGAQTLLDGDSPDLDAYEAKIKEAANQMVQAHARMATAAVEARQLLDAGQRERLALARAMMKEMGGGMMGGGMMHRDQDDSEGHGHER
ncbi:MAG: Spy/CpxP family protein refolding chaperone [Gemmatimonadetes bacterium]|nr:Spy/CpxP family protein refolding chaperone [Gemmatimonadota bacterium]MBT8478876.1 Spy/CpxP family protein refolding chaperone [Gemmatimonadota bacterium]